MPKGIYEHKPLTEQHKANISAGVARYWQSPEGQAQRITYSKYWTGRAEQKARMMGNQYALGCKHPPEFGAAISARMIGNQNARKDGKSAYETAQRTLARERDKHTCQTEGCNVTSKSPGRLIDTHHRNFDPDNHDLDNLECQCRPHHVTLHVEHRKQKSKRTEEVRQ